MQKINFEDGQLVKKGYVEIDGTQYSTEEAEYDGATPLSAHVLNKMQDNIEEAINNVQALPIGGTTGQVLTKKSETYGDVEWSTVEGNEVYIGNEADAPATAKIVIDEEETGWEDEGEIYSTTERRIGTWIDGKPLYRKVVSVSGHPAQISHGISNLKKVISMRGFVSRSSDVVKSQNLPHADIDVKYVIDANYASDSLIYMEYGSEIINNITEVTWILEYTKTTD